MKPLASTPGFEAPVPARNPRGRWDLGEATAYQNRLRALVETRDRLGMIRVVAGADVSYARGESDLYAAVVNLDASSLETLEVSSVRSTARFPYLPGYLSFREAPAILEAFAGLRGRPDLLLVDGHGLAHPRGFGLACHLGLLLDVPAIGVAKTVLVGDGRAPALSRGSRTALVHRGRRIGTVLRTRRRVNPVYVSIGHRVSLPTAERLTLACTGRYRIPEPTRQAHLEVNRLRADHGRRRAG